MQQKSAFTERKFCKIDTLICVTQGELRQTVAEKPVVDVVPVVRHQLVLFGVKTAHGIARQIGLSQREPCFRVLVYSVVIPSVIITFIVIKVKHQVKRDRFARNQRRIAVVQNQQKRIS